MLSPCYYRYYELTEIPPRIEQLAELLNRAPYAGALTEPDVDPKLKKTFEEINEMVQASPAEIKFALKKLNAFEIDGCWRVLKEDYTAEIFRVILLSAVTDDIPLHRMALSAVMKGVTEQDVPVFVAKAILETFGEPVDAAVSDESGGGGGSAEDEQLFKLTVRNICRFEALELLKLQERWPYHSFLESWSEALPEGMITDPEYLDGLALLSDGSTGGGGAELCYFPVATLPVNVKQRFLKLFDRQAKWSMKQIRPYLEDLAIGLLTVEKMLFKHARGFTDTSSGESIKMYNKR
jgi:sister chromatid cohesion protein DCC1